MKRLILLIPLVLLFFICGFSLLYLISGKEANKPPSALINKELPKFLTKSLFDENVYLSSDNIKRNVNITIEENINSSSDNSNNKFTVINFFASWCAPCREEHHLLFELKNNQTKLFLLGIAHKDNPSDTKKYLDNDGNPYSFVGLDEDGKIALEFGVFGLPETFIVNNYGKIIFKHIGPLTKNIIKNEIEPLL